MARYTIVTEEDAGTGHVALSVQSPDGAILARSGPVYASQADAEARLLDAIAKAWPTEPVDPVYPANGS